MKKVPQLSEIAGYPQIVLKTLISKVEEHVMIDKVSKLLWLLQAWTVLDAPKQKEVYDAGIPVINGSQ